jgi:tetratricopeptide (TPR) repeat protein
MRPRVLLAAASIAISGFGCLHSNSSPSPSGDTSIRPQSSPSVMSTSANTNSGTNTTANLNAVPGQQELPGKPAGALLLAMAEGLEKGGKDVEAISYYERAREADPKLAERASRRLAVLYDKADDQTRAMHEFQELLKKKPKDANLLNDVGYSCYNRGQWAEAENYLRRATALDKNLKQAWVNLGLALAQQGKQIDALEAFGHAVSNAEAYANLGFVYAVQGKKEVALAVYRRSLDLEPTLKISQAAVARLERNEPLHPENAAVSP